MSIAIPKNLSRRVFVGAIPVSAALSACSALSRAGTTRSGSTDQGGPIVLGVSGPRTGANAECGQYWQEGFDLALEELSVVGGVDGRKVELKWEDSQSDSKRSVPIVQRSVAGTTAIAELGGFSSGTSMAVSATCQQVGFVQFGFTNSNPDFTKDGDHVWSTSLIQESYQTRVAQWIAGSYQRTSVVYLESDWGKSSFDTFKAAVAEAGLEVVYESSIQPDSEDYRPVLIKACDAEPWAVVRLGYGPGGVCIVRQLREIGSTGQFLSGQNTPQPLEAVGSAARGTTIIESFLIGNGSPAVADFGKRFRDRLRYDPSTFSTYIYDALNVLAEAVRHGSAAREDVFRALSDGGRWKTVQFGELESSTDRHPGDVTILPVTAKNGACVLAEAS